MPARLERGQGYRGMRVMGGEVEHHVGTALAKKLLHVTIRGPGSKAPLGGYRPLFLAVTDGDQQSPLLNPVKLG